jgi:O-antigen/teichoic acid export membrane protein
VSLYQKIRSQPLRRLVPVLDQAVLSLSNLVFSILIGRSVSIREFAIFGIIFSSWIVIQGIQKSLISDVAIIRYGSSKDDRYIAGGIIIAAVISTAFSLVCILCAFVLGRLSLHFGLFFLLVPLLTTQDGVRYMLIAQRRYGAALAGSVIMAAVMVCGAVIVSYFRPLALVLDNLGSFIAIWGIAALVSGTVLLVWLGPLGGREPWQVWRGSAITTGAKFALDFMSYALTQQGVTFAIAAMGNVLAVAAIRGGQVLLGPIGVLSTGLGTILLSGLSSRSGDIRLIRYACMAFGGALAAISLVIGLLIYVLPVDWGRQLLGQSWTAAASVAPGIALSYALNSMGYAASIGLRVREEAGKGIKVRAVTLPVTIVLVPLGVYMFDLQGAILSLIITSAISCSLWWRYLLQLEPQTERGR